MQTLHQATPAILITAATTHRGVFIMLDEGTEYETTSLTFDPLGFCRKRITVQGEQYDIFE